MYVGGFDLVAKASEGIKNSASLQAVANCHLGAAHRLPLTTYH